jgi:hypothetical protein
VHFYSMERCLSYTQIGMAGAIETHEFFAKQDVSTEGRDIIFSLVPTII